MAASTTWVAFLVALGCATPHDNLDARDPGDRCLETCPEGMRCAGTTRMKVPKRTYPGRCELLPGRCASDPDCGRGRQCVRTTERIGLCAPSPRP
jgi:hypothetical protein